MSNVLTAMMRTHDMTSGANHPSQRGRCPRRLRANALFDQRPRRLDRVEIVRVRWQVAQAGATPLDERAHVGSLVRLQIVEEHHVTTMQARHEAALGRGLARAGSPRRPVLVVACDGAHAPTRPAGGRNKKRGPGAWKEAKGVRLYLLGRDHRIIHVASWHEIGDKEHVSTALGIIAARIPRDQVRVALVADGAEWTWDVMRRSFPDGEEILDYYHCDEHVHGTAHAQFGEYSSDTVRSRDKLRQRWPPLRHPGMRG
jgi:hypothetical protein